METEIKNQPSLIKVETLDQLKKLIPKRYYKEFAKQYQEDHGKKEKAPSRQMVYLTLAGKSNDLKTLETLKAMAAKRIEFSKELNETVNAFR